MKKNFSLGTPVSSLKLTFKKVAINSGKIKIDHKLWADFIDFGVEHNFLHLVIYKNGEKIDELSDEILITRIFQRHDENSKFEICYEYVPDDVLLFSATLNIDRNLFKSLFFEILNIDVVHDKLTLFGTESFLSKYDSVSLPDRIGFLEKYALYILDKIVNIEDA